MVPTVQDIPSDIVVDTVPFQNPNAEKAAESLAYNPTDSVFYQEQTPVALFRGLLKMEAEGELSLCHARYASTIIK